MKLSEFLKKPVRKFDNVEDVYNKGNRLSGYICLESSKYYGALYITEINNKKCEPQLVLSSPKMHYPFGKDGIFRIRQVPNNTFVYQKYDGTAIIGYAYSFQNKVYITYKTRLTVVTQGFDVYDFTKMWKEMLKKYPEIDSLISLKRTVVFELYGILNKHLIIYNTPLDTTLLFGIDRTTDNIISPKDIKTNNIPNALLYNKINKQDNFIKFYNNLRNKIEKNNEIMDSGIIGSEGAVVYIPDKKLGYIQYKLKPESVMAIHCKPGLNKKDIITTCYNALENISLEELNYNYIKTLLLEEITEREIEVRKETIEKCILNVKDEVKLRKQLIIRYKKCGKSIHKNKNDVMRYMSNYFPKNKMRYIYTILFAYEKN